MFDQERIVAVGFLTREEVQVVGRSLKHVYTLPLDDKFNDLLRALDGEPYAAGGTMTQPPSL